MFRVLILIILFLCQGLVTCAQEENSNPRPSIISSLCIQGCKAGHKVCRLQKKEDQNLLTVCDETLKRCNDKCLNK